jgi:hypothetical protein
MITNQCLRLFSTKKATQNVIMSYADILLQENESLHLSDLFQQQHQEPSTTTPTDSSTSSTSSTTIIPYPTALSPSAAAEFKACPQSYLFQYLYGIRQPTNLALAKGRICHGALEHLFDLEPSQRTLEQLHNLFRFIWSKERLKEEYVHLFDVPVTSSLLSDQVQRDLEAERKWGLESLRLLENYYHLEDPRLIPRQNPLEREIWVQAKLTLDPSKGVTGTTTRGSHVPSVEDGIHTDETFLVRGIVDRLDYVAVPTSPQDTFLKTTEETLDACVRIVDYKTGKAPEFKYSPSMNEQIANQNMWQLKIYALLLKEMIAGNNNNNTNSKSGNLKYILPHQLRLLRLMYLTSEDGKARYLDMDLGETEEEQNRVLQEVHNDLSEIWKGIGELVQTQDPKAFRHCQRKFCVCHTLRPKFVRGSLYHDE